MVQRGRWPRTRTTCGAPWAARDVSGERLDEITDAAKLNGWFAELTSPDAGRRALSAAYLGHHPDPRALPTLLGALADADHDVAVEAVAALSRQGEEARVPLRQRLEDAHPQVREMAAYALAMRGDAACLPSLVRLAADGAREALRALGRARPNVAQVMTLDWAQRTGDVGMLRDALGDGEAHVRAFAAWALGARGGADDVDELARVAATDLDSAVRVAAAISLGAVGAAEATILEVLDNQFRFPAFWDGGVIVALVRALGAAGGEGATAFLTTWEAELADTLSDYGEPLRHRSVTLEAIRRAIREIGLRQKAG